VVSFAQASVTEARSSAADAIHQFGHMSKNCKTVLDNEESKRGGSDDSDSVGSGGGKAAWNFSQIEKDVKWQRAMDDDSLCF